MPKIKVKHVPEPTRRRLCEMRLCKSCRFWMEDKGFCMLATDYDPGDMTIELFEKDFPTNREWLESLSDEDLAAFYTLGIPLKDSSYISLYKVVMSFTSSQQGIKEWLSQPCKYLMEEE